MLVDADILHAFRRIWPLLKSQEPTATFYDACLVVSDLTAEPFPRVFDICLEEDGDSPNE